MVAFKTKRAERQETGSKKDGARSWEKNDEELDLEERLFGTSRKRRKASPAIADGDDSEEESASDDGIKGMKDSDLFTIDAPLADVSEDEAETDVNAVENDDGDDSDDDEDDEDSEEDEEEDSEDEQDSDADSDTSSDSGLSITAFDNTPPGSPKASKSKKGKNGQQPELSFPAFDAEGEEDGPMGVEHHPSDPMAPSISVPSNIYSEPHASGSRSALAGADGSRKGKARQSVWEDESDRAIVVDAEKDRRLKKLARGKEGGSQLTGGELELRLREQFEKLHPRPEWASLRARAGHPSLSLLLSSTKSFIDSNGSASGQEAGPSNAARVKRGPLPPGEVKVQKLRNANYQNPTTGKREAKGAGHGVVDLAWHPSTRLSVLAVCGGDRRVRIFNVDGDTNPPLMTLHIPSLPLTRGTFHPSGSSLLFTGPRPYYYIYDLASQRCLRSPRNLFGSRPSPSAPNSLHRHAFSPDGSLLAVAGLRGAVSVMEWNQGAGAVIAELKSGRGGSVVDLSWGENGKELSVLGGRDGAEVEIWNVAERSVVRRWADDRAFGGSSMRTSRDSSYTAIGSNTGIVNLYASSSLRSASRKKSKAGADELDEIPTVRPEPIKSLEHLTTPITSLDFHPEGQMLVTATNGKRDALKLYHLPTASAFSNWPTSTTALGRVTDVKFSSDGQYLSAGNQSGRVGLWRLRHFAPE